MTVPAPVRKPVVVHVDAQKPVNHSGAIELLRTVLRAPVLENLRDQLVRDGEQLDHLKGVVTPVRRIPHAVVPQPELDFMVGVAANLCKTGMNAAQVEPLAQANREGQRGLGVLFQMLRTGTVQSLTQADVERGLSALADAKQALAQAGVVLSGPTEQNIRKALEILKAPFAEVEVAPAKMDWAHPFTSFISKALADVAASGVRYRIRVQYADGRSYESAPDPEITITFKNKKAQRETVALGYFGLMESYIRGDVDITGDDAMRKLIHMSAMSKAGAGDNLLVKAKQLIFELAHTNASYINAKDNATHHYGMPSEFFRMVLGRTYGYCEGLYPIGNESVTDAQHKRFDAAAQRLRLDQPGLSVVEVGSGWGYMSALMAKKYGANVVNIGLVGAQNDTFKDLVRGNGLDGQVKLIEGDHRDIGNLGEKFDRYVSLGVYEHSGFECHEAWIKSIADALKPGASGVLATMSRAKRAFTNPLITKYIFPGGYMPSMAQTLQLMEKHGLVLTEAVDARQDYGRACEDWQERLVKNWSEIQKINPKIFTESLLRAWQIYLLGSAGTFSGPNDNLTVHHMSFVKGRDNVRHPQVQVQLKAHEKALRYLP